MEDKKNYLRSSQYPRRRGCGCLGCLISLGIVVFICVVLGVIARSGGGLPVLAHSVGVVRIEGPINESQNVVRILSGFRKNPFIKAIVLRLDTPGGAVGASEEIYQEVVRCRKEGRKKVIASMGNAAASGGYYIAVGADEIYANAGTLTGSIGVIAMDWNVEDTLSKLGVRPEVLKSGVHKDTGSPFRQMTPGDRQVLLNVLYDVYRQFFRTVLSQRHKQIERVLDENTSIVQEVLRTTESVAMAEPPPEMEPFTTGTMAADTGATLEAENALRIMADGRVMSGQQALKLGLIDKIGTLQDAISRAGEVSGLGGDPPVSERRPESALPALFGATARQFWNAFSPAGQTVEYRSTP